MCRNRNVIVVSRNQEKEKLHVYHSVMTSWRLIVIISIHLEGLSLPVLSVWIRFSIILWTVEVFIIKATIFQNMIKHKWKKNDIIWILDIVAKIFIFLYFESLSSSKSQIYRTSGDLSSNKVASYHLATLFYHLTRSQVIASFIIKKKHLASMLSLLTNTIIFPYLPQYSFGSWT